MVKVDYICTKDINKVAKIHSSKKYFNWIMKIIDNEYRFYPPLIIEEDEDYLDDFEFEAEDEDTTELDTVLLENSINKEEKTPMIGELWENTTKFFTEDRFNLVGILESKTDKKMRAISKNSNSLAKIEKYKDKKVSVSRNMSTKINKEKYTDYNLNSDSYKLYRVKQCSNKLVRLEKYKEEIDDEELRTISEIVTEKVKKLFDKKPQEIEILSFDEEYA